METMEARTKLTFQRGLRLPKGMSFCISRRWCEFTLRFSEKAETPQSWRLRLVPYKTFVLDGGRMGGIFELQCVWRKVFQ